MSPPLAVAAAVAVVVMAATMRRLRVAVAVVMFLPKRVLHLSQKQFLKLLLVVRAPVAQAKRTLRLPVHPAEQRL